MLIAAAVSATETAREWPDQGAWTYDDYRRLPDDGWRYEVIRGRLYMSPAPRPDHQRSSRGLFRALDRFIEDRDLGEVFFAPIDVNLPGLASPVQPDLLFIRKERLAIVQEDFIDGAPDLIAEVLSPSNWILDRREKYQLYAAAGVGKYWIVDPAQRTIEVFVLEGGSYRLFAQRGPGETIRSRLFPELEVEIDDVLPAR
jgi:Uma2 family endonuclease